ncbi:hypothetical protein A1F94_012120 [Pyrenophora tritici-repentis]|nr:hypothetical protein A1F99_000950 [Pyrenophora tritici-repentis]KAG9377717.1 hypothetical protein A1F94_012120 [Pyrenophora tritici-repentis]KAI0576899.1 hypothetical protein Alg215_07240 [Pyrenophora tritici-repentis]KAI0587622.1 hypothetical protein Alg130_03727 [Pyrenophora tritici-repentis]KAI0611003.1 hypothetical protein TUN205_04723 [Pyrenophora tritici-repentis]
MVPWFDRTFNSWFTIIDTSLPARSQRCEIKFEQTHCVLEAALPTYIH